MKNQSPDSTYDVSSRDKNAYNFLHLAESLAPTAELRSRLKGRKDSVRKRIIQKLNKKKYARAIQIDRVKNITPNEFREQYMNRGLPVVFEGAAKEWDCSRKWSMDFFQANHGRDHALLMEADLDLNWLDNHRNPWSPANGFQLFIDGGGTRTKLQCAMQGNFFVMVQGEKQWRLLPSRYNSVINPPADRALYNRSSVDVYKPDLSEFPGFDKIDYYDVHLKPGDIFYNPPFMWHDVMNLTDSIGVAYRFGCFLGAVKASSTLTFMGMTAKNPSAWKSLWHKIKDINPVYASTNGTFKEVYDKLNQRIENK